MPVVGAPEVRSTFGLGYAVTSLILFVLPELFGFLLEPPLFILSDKIGRRRLVPLGLVFLGVCFATAGLANNAIVFSIAMVLIYPASGVGIGLSQVSLIEAYPRQRERVMARWTMMGAIGDVGSPLLLAAIAAVGGSWRVGFVFIGVVLVLHGFLVSRARWRERTPVKDEAEEPGFFRMAAEGLRNRRLWVWATGVALCALLDEILVAFAAMYLTDDLHATHVQVDIVIASFGLGSIVGLSILDRLLPRASSQRLLTGACLGTIATYLAWLWSPQIPVSIACMFLVGVFASPLYPIAAGRAYEAAPSRAGTAAAIMQLFAPVTLAWPLILGRIADQLGLRIALALLLLQPIGVLLIALFTARAPRSERRSRTTSEPPAR